MQTDERIECRSVLPRYSHRSLKMRDTFGVIIWAENFTLGFRDSELLDPLLQSNETLKPGFHYPS